MECRFLKYTNSSSFNPVLKPPLKGIPALIEHFLQDYSVVEFLAVFPNELLQQHLLYHTIFDDILTRGHRIREGLVLEFSYAHTYTTTPIITVTISAPHYIHRFTFEVLTNTRPSSLSIDKLVW